MSAWNGRRVLVTGATGLVGGWLCRELLDRGADVFAFVRDLDPASLLVREGSWDRLSGATWGRVEHTADVERALLDHRPDTVIHLAAQTQVRAAHRSPLATFESNVMGTAALLDACRRQPETLRGVVVASSDKAYGDTGATPATEDHVLGGTFPYDASKAATELVTRSYVATYGLPATIARCGNIFGGGDLNYDRLIPGCVRWLLRGEPPRLRSDGTFVRDYVYVRDVVDGYLALAERAADDGVRGEAFNLSNDSPRSVLALLDELQEVMGTALEPLIEDNAPAEIHTQVLSAARARDVLGWSPSWGLRKGLEETVAWYRAHLGAAPASGAAS
jgi:CDP-glucose 4,6-dehydratase